jgi:hypothetical protein
MQRLHLKFGHELQHVVYCSVLKIVTTVWLDDDGGILVGAATDPKADHQSDQTPFRQLPAEMGDETPADATSAGGSPSLNLPQFSWLDSTSSTTLAPLSGPSGRFDNFVDMGNPMKGINLFPFLRRRVEGRALRAMGAADTLELSRTVAEAGRWPREVCWYLTIP